MNGADAIDFVARLAGPRIRQILAVAMGLAILVFHRQAIEAFNWYVTQRADDIVHHFNTILPTMSQSPSSP